MATNDAQHLAVLMAEANRQFALWSEAVTSGDFARAAEIAAEAIRLNNAAVVPAELADNHFAVRVMLNGFRDLANLANIVARPNWIRHPQAVEEVWRLLQSAKDRITVDVGLPDSFVEYWTEQLRPIFEAINNQYGPGIYTSWELISKTLTCTICDLDIRACNHEIGEWYDGRRCAYSPDDSYIGAIALVENPRDPTCRIWPWKVKRKTAGEEGATVTVSMYPYQPEGEPDGGTVIDPDKLFTSDGDSHDG